MKPKTFYTHRDSKIGIGQGSRANFLDEKGSPMTLRLWGGQATIARGKARGADEKFAATPTLCLGVPKNASFLGYGVGQNQFLNHDVYTLEKV